MKHTASVLVAPTPRREFLMSESTRNDTPPAAATHDNNCGHNPMPRSMGLTHGDIWGVVDTVNHDEAGEPHSEGDGARVVRVVTPGAPGFDSSGGCHGDAVGVCCGNSGHAGSCSEDVGAGAAGIVDASSCSLLSASRPVVSALCPSGDSGELLCDVPVVVERRYVTLPPSADEGASGAGDCRG